MTKPNERVIAHIDCDSFYAQVEHKRLGVPLSVPLGVQQWSGLIAVNYAAKKYGVKRGMSCDEAKKLCPNLVLAPVQYLNQNNEGTHQLHQRNVTKVSLRRYRIASFKVMSVIREFVESSCVQRTSLDEVYIDLTDRVSRMISKVATCENPKEQFKSLCDRVEETSRFMGEDKLDYEQEGHVRLAVGALICHEIRHSAKHNLGYTLSAGIATNKLVAKLASAKNKPDLQTIVTQSAGIQMLRELPISDIPGYGRKLGTRMAIFVDEQLKKRFGSNSMQRNNSIVARRENNAFNRNVVPKVTLTDLERTNLDQVRDEFGAKNTDQLLQALRGVDQTKVLPAMAPKSLNSMKSFPSYLYEDAQVVEWLRLLTIELVGRVEDDKEMFSRVPTMFTIQIRRPAVVSGGSSARSQSKDFSKRAPLPFTPPALYETDDEQATISNQCELFVQNVIESCRSAMQTTELRGLVPCSRLGLQFHKFVPQKHSVSYSTGTEQRSISSFFEIKDAQIQSEHNCAKRQVETSDNMQVTQKQQVGTCDNMQVTQKQQVGTCDNMKTTQKQQVGTGDNMKTTQKQQVGTCDNMKTTQKQQVGTSDPSAMNNQHNNQSQLNHSPTPSSLNLRRTSKPSNPTQESNNITDSRHQSNQSSKPAAVTTNHLNKTNTAPDMNRPQSSRDMGADAFVDKFYQASRLHFIGSWKQRFQDLLRELPPLPPLPLPDAPVRVYFHVDMDAFFASVALLSHPELKTEPVAVCWGSQNNRNGEISSANYIARKFGIRAGMWAKRAYELCPKLKTLPFEFEKYSTIAEAMYRILFSVTLHVEGMSCDEAYLDITEAVSKPGYSPSKLAAELRARIFNETGCTASIGCSSSRLLAKMATTKAKPNGYFELAPSKTKLFLESLPLRDLPGVGYKTCKRIESNFANIKTCGELAKVSVQSLQKVFGNKTGQNLADLSRGIDNRPWNPRPPRQSIGAQISWGVRMGTTEEVHEFLRKLAQQVETRLCEAGHKNGGKAIVTKIWRAVPTAPSHMRKGHLGHGVCDIITRSATLSFPVVKADDISKVACKVYDELRIQATEVRGAGLTVSGFTTVGDSTNGARDVSQQLIAQRSTALSKREAGPSSLFKSKKFDGYRSWSADSNGVKSNGVEKQSVGTTKRNSPAQNNLFQKPKGAQLFASSENCSGTNRSNRDEFDHKMDDPLLKRPLDSPMDDVPLKKLMKVDKVLLKDLPKVEQVPLKKIAKIDEMPLKDANSKISTKPTSVPQETRISTRNNTSTLPYESKSEQGLHSNQNHRPSAIQSNNISNNNNNNRRNELINRIVGKFEGQLMLVVLTASCSKPQCPRNMNKAAKCIACRLTLESSLEDIAVQLSELSSFDEGREQYCTILQRAKYLCMRWSFKLLPRDHWLSNYDNVDSDIHSYWMELVSQVEQEASVAAKDIK